MQINLHDFFRGVHPWPKLYRFLTQLPDGCRYRAAQSLDVELAEHLYELSKKEEKARDDLSDAPKITPRSSAGYTAEISLLMTISDQMQQLTNTLIAVNLPKGKRPPKVRPIPRPVSMLEVITARHEYDEVNSVLAEILPDSFNIIN